MSGHSKWATIKRAKGATDAKRGQLFTRLARAIVMAAREGGGNPDSNFSLRLAIEKARGANMPKDNIERAISRATGAGDDAINFEELVYEGYGPAKVPMLIKVATDNRNRTLGDVRKALSKAGGMLGEAGSVGWQFNRKGVITIEKSTGANFDKVFELALEAGAEDIKENDEQIEVITEVESLRAVRDALNGAKISIGSAEISYLPTTAADISDDDMGRVANVIEVLEELDDVQQVYTNIQ
jgi:YebC/PmpR family DNA-binding regulatory protein